MGNTIGSIAVINIFGVTFGRASSINKNLNLVSGTSAVTGGVNIVTLAFIQRQRCVAQNHVSARLVFILPTDKDTAMHIGSV